MRKPVSILTCLLAFVYTVSGQANPSQADTTPEGVLLLPEGVSLRVVSEKGDSFWVEPDNGQATLPSGHYSVRNWVFEKKDGEGPVWNITGYPTSSTGFEISATSASLRIIPEPITATLTVGYQDDIVFSQALHGPAGERLYVYRGDEQVPPRLEITNEARNFNITLTGTYG